ncbi:MAG: enolase C-terminal domain-like protein [Verrucomicrobiota bacterium]
MRVPLKFGAQVLTSVVCARVCVELADEEGRNSSGWGETPLSVGWVWPSEDSFDEREDRLKRFCVRIAEALSAEAPFEHPLPFTHAFNHESIPRLIHEEVAEVGGDPSSIPQLASLACLASFDLAIYDAFANYHGVPVFETFSRDWLTEDLASLLEPAEVFRDKYPSDYFRKDSERLPVWHLVGGLDPVDESELTGSEPKDGYPVLLRDWIRADGLKCLKIKLRGDDEAWDVARIEKIGDIANEEEVDWLTTDFNCTVKDPDYVNGILDRLKRERADTFSKLLYVEQPFPHDLEANQIDVQSVSSRKPLFLDESAHDWKFVRLGYELGWNGVALKTCKTLTGAILSLCWAREHGMGLMVQDLTNPMLAMIPHCQLAAHAGTIMGVECNGMQFYPAASLPEEAVHPGIYRRRDGIVDLSTLGKTGFGYRVEEINRGLPDPAFEVISG